MGHVSRVHGTTQRPMRLELKGRGQRRNRAGVMGVLTGYPEDLGFS